MTVDLSDKKMYDLIQRSDNPTILGETINEPKKIIKVNKVYKNCKKEGSLLKFVRNLFIIIICLFLIYITIFRYVLGYNFFKGKEYMKTAAVLSPELISISTLLL